MTEHTKTAAQQPRIPGESAEEILKQISSWGNVTTVILHLGNVFEFKGPFPIGTFGSGFYNLEGATPGLQGHLKLEAVDHISFQEKPHRGVESYALVFNNIDNKAMFKIFLGRDENRQLLQHQKEKFMTLKENYTEHSI